MDVQPADRPAQASAKPGAGRTGTPEATRSASRARRIAFRVLAILTSLLLLLYFVFALTEVVLMWLPDETLSSMLDEDFAEIAPHRSHFMSVGIVAWAAVLGLLVQLRRPERRVAPLLQLLVVVVSGAVVYGLSGTAGEWLVEEGTILAPVLLLVFLHPRARQLLRRPGFDRPLAGLATVAAVPWAVYLVVNARLQLLDAAGDPHADMEHWATAALMAIVIVACAFLGASDHAGWRLPAWTAAAAATIFGAHSLVFPGLASGLSTFWAVAAIAWGVAFGARVVIRPHPEQARSAP